MHFHQCTDCDNLTRCMTEACRNAGYKTCSSCEKRKVDYYQNLADPVSESEQQKVWCYDHYQAAGHCSFIRKGKSWACATCGESEGEITLEQVLGREGAQSYQQAYDYIHSMSGDLSRKLDVGDSIYAHGMGVDLNKPDPRVNA